MTNLQQRLRETLDELPKHVQLVAVSKFHPAEAVTEAYAEGQRIFGESRVQELLPKHDALPGDIDWHFIGTLQRNKVKYIAPFISLIHSVDNVALLEEINKQGRRADRTIRCLLELHIAQEESKSGWEPEACCQWLEQGAWHDMHNVQICGLMCMASHTDDEARIRQDFRAARQYFNRLKQGAMADCPAFAIRSWGMSDDWRIAVEEGSNMVRIGTRIFGERAY